MTESETDFLSEAEIRARIEKAYADFPGLRGFTPPSTCCGGCKETDVAEVFGRPAANAWASVDCYRWLLGEE